MRTSTPTILQEWVSYFQVMLNVMNGIEWLLYVIFGLLVPRRRIRSCFSKLRRTLQRSHAQRTMSWTIHQAPPAFFLVQYIETSIWLSFVVLHLLAEATSIQKPEAQAIYGELQGCIVSEFIPSRLQFLHVPASFFLYSFTWHPPNKYKTNNSN